MGIISAYMDDVNEKNRQRHIKENVEAYNTFVNDMKSCDFDYFVVTVVDPVFKGKDYYEPKNFYNFIDYPESERCGRVIKIKGAEVRKFSSVHLNKYLVVVYKKIDDMYYDLFGLVKTVNEVERLNHYLINKMKYEYNIIV